MQFYVAEAYLDPEEKFWDYRTAPINGKEIFDLHQTGTSYYNDFLTKDGNEYMKKNKGLKGEIVQMSPNEYFKGCAKIFRTSVEDQKRVIMNDTQTMQDLEEIASRFGKRFCLPYLNFAHSGQEGRHRMAYAGEKFGWDEKFPVLVVTKARADESIDESEYGTAKVQFMITEDVLDEDIEGMKKYYPNIPEMDFMKFIELDPTYKGGDNAGTYARWILNLANKGQLNNIGHVKDILTRFDEVKKNLVTKDIMRFKSMEELENFLNDENSYTDLTHRQEVRARQKDRKNADLEKEASLVYEDSDWEVWVPHTYAASCKLGQGTSWCTASTESDYYYEYYRGNYGGEYYINISKKDPEEKYQFHFESGQFMDKDDDSIDLADLLGANKGLSDFYFDAVVKKEMDIPDGATELEVRINKSDIAEAASGNTRDGLSSEFIRAAIDGELWDEFQGYSGYWADSDHKEVIRDCLPDDLKPKIKAYYIAKYGDDDAEEYEDLDEDAQIAYFVENDDGLNDAFRYAYNTACNDGAINEAEEYVNKEIMDAMPYFVIKGKSSLWDNGVDCTTSKIVCDVARLKETWYEGLANADGNSSVSIVAASVLGSLEEANLTEPYYGFSGFSEESFRELINDELSQLGGWNEVSGD